jgi:hypothetical protein
MSYYNNTFLAPWGANTAKEYATQVGGNMSAAPAQFAGVMGGMYDSYNKGYGTYNQGLGSLGNSYAQNYAAMANGIAGTANALGNTWNNAQSGNQAVSSAEAARQVAISNLGTAAMSNYGNVAGLGMQAWAQNQQGYQRSLADMTSANQGAISGLGQSRNSALAGLGKSASALGIGGAVSSTIPGLGQSFGTGGSGGGGGYGAYDSSGIGRGYQAIDDLRGDVNRTYDYDQLSGGFNRGMDSLNADQAIARDMPRTMTADAYAALRDFNVLNLDASTSGMNQFYDFSRDSMENSNRPGQAIPTGSILEALAGGYTDSANRIGGVQNDMRSGWGDAKSAYGSAAGGVRSLWDDSIGNTGIFNSRSQNQQEQYGLEDAAKARQVSQQAAASAGMRDYHAANQQAWRDGVASGMYRPQGTGWQTSKAR